MARNWGSTRVAAAVIVLLIACVLSYFVLLYLVRPHPAVVDYPVPSDLPPGAEVHEGGYIVMPYDPNSTVAGPVDNSGADGTVSFLELPLWIQLYALPGIIAGVALSFIGAALVVRRARKNDNGNKREVLTYISDNLGCTAPELARGRGLNIGTVRYHIRRLQDESRIVLQKIGKYTRIYVNSHTYDDREKLIASHLRSDPSRLILGTLVQTPGISNQKLSEKLGMEKSLVYRYMQKLLDDDIVTFEWEGKNKLYYISQNAKEPLNKLMPLHYQCPGLMKE
jgi:predicted transcriptional regulator